jgi:hypothetical protein
MKLFGFLVVVGASLVVIGAFQQWWYAAPKARWAKTPYLRRDKGGLGDEPAWVTYQRIQAEFFGGFGTKVGKLLVVVGLAGLAALAVARLL